MTSEDFQIRKAKLLEQGKKVVVLGASGETGKEVTKLLLELQLFPKVVFISRRRVENADERFKNVEQRIVNFDKLEEYADDFKGFDVCFCSFGTITGKGGSDYLYKVDHDYLMGAAKLLAAGGCKEFHFVSTMWAHRNFFHMYQRTKAQVEQELAELKFEKLFIYRAALLMCDRVEHRLGEKLRLIFFTYIVPFLVIFREKFAMPTDILAKAMINRSIATVSGNSSAVEVLENCHIHRAAKWNEKPAITW